MYGKLPRMVDPLGKHWGHRIDLRDRVKIHWNHATIDEADWLALPRYESSLPTGTYAGKAWRRGKWLCWYGREKDGMITVGRTRALVQGPGTNLTYRE